jgi:hypothetical protein
LHAVVASRSPWVARMLNETHKLHLCAEKSERFGFQHTREDPNITEDAIQIVLGHLYVPHYSVVDPQNALQVLATAHLFELEDLCAHATNIARANISYATVLYYLKWVVQAPAYGPYTAHVQEQVECYVMDGLPDDLNAFLYEIDNRYVRGPGYEQLVDIYARLPSRILRAALEGNNIARLNRSVLMSFAQDLVVRRRQIGCATEEESVAYDIIRKKVKIRVVRKRRCA